MNKTYILNLESNKIELHFEKQEYLNLSQDLKKELKSSFLFSNYSKCWVSRSTNNHWRAIDTAKKLGFTEEEKKGTRLSFEEQLQRQAEKAENKIERYEQYADNAIKRAENLQADRERYQGDISFWTQPIIANHSGSQRFANYRQKVMDRYMRGFEEYQKSEYYKNKIALAQSTASQEQFKNKTYLYNRIKESKKALKDIQNSITIRENNIKRIQNGEELKNYNNEIITIEMIENKLMSLLDDYNWEQDKLIFLNQKLEEVGGVQYSKENIKTGYLVKIRGRWDVVIKANPTTIEVKTEHGSYLKYSYAEIQEVKIPENYQEVSKKINDIENPFKIGDIFCNWSIGGGYLIRAYQVLKTTDKTIKIQEIEKENNKPLKDKFLDKKAMSKKISKDINGNYRIMIDDWSIYKYAE